MDEKDEKDEEDEKEEECFSNMLLHCFSRFIVRNFSLFWTILFLVLIDLWHFCFLYRLLSVKYFSHAGSFVSFWFWVSCHIHDCSASTLWQRRRTTTSDNNNNNNNNTDSHHHYHHYHHHDYFSSPSYSTSHITPSHHSLSFHHSHHSHHSSHHRHSQKLFSPNPFLEYVCTCKERRRRRRRRRKKNVHCPFVESILTLTFRPSSCFFFFLCFNIISTFL